MAESSSSHGELVVTSGLDGVAKVPGQVEPQSCLEAFLDLTDTLARHTEANGERRKRLRLVGQQASPKDGQLPSRQSLFEDLQMPLEMPGEVSILEPHVWLPTFDAAGHRVVHGGTRFREAVVIDENVRKELEGLSELDPEHMQPLS